MNTPSESLGPHQLEIDFASDRGPSGFSCWREQRRATLHEMARQLGLPLGHRVEVRFHDGVRMEGLLELAAERLFAEETRNVLVELKIGRVVFRLAEMESCVRLD